MAGEKMINFTPFPGIETENLILRRMNHKDMNDLFEMRKDPSMNDHTDTKPDETIDDTKMYIDKMNKGIDDNKWIIWAIEHKETGKVIGSISIWNINSSQESAELGFGIIPGYQGRGLMQEVLLSVIGYGFDVMNLRALDGYAEENNIRSINLLRRCNFIETDRVDDEGYFNNRTYHMIVYRLENSDQK
jgi:[ribosomal protein S5]-alanine N-acetyltransferase